MVTCAYGEWIGRFASRAGQRLELLNDPAAAAAQAQAQAHAGPGAGRGARPPLCLAPGARYLELMRESGGGAPVNLEPCGDGPELTHQSWRLDPATQSVVSLAPETGGGGGKGGKHGGGKHGGGGHGSGKQCLTVGWPFVQAVAALVPDGAASAASPFSAAAPAAAGAFQGAPAVVVVNEADSAVAVEVAFEDGTTIAANLPARGMQTFRLPAHKAPVAPALS